MQHQIIKKTSTYITTDLGVTGNAAAGMNELTKAEIL